MNASWWNDSNEDRLFWTVFGSLLLFGVALDIVAKDDDISRWDLMVSIGIGVLPATVYWGIGRHGRSAVYRVVQRAGWARAEAAFQHLQEALRTPRVLWWTVVVVGRAVVALSLIGVSLLVDGLSQSNVAIVVGLILAAVYFLLGGRPIRWMRRVIEVAGELT